ncbi:E3 SUMO-protein ligase RanBP2 [Paragonimus westermani]|uniref:Nuclear pore complex protein Nup153 n=1 Tax=Paragonimus westermani TaxID=34504 RepID=A0A5J4NV33_9TREM|nr:E3 SUMO-protein ligase RanBP2 [Paragonimus westermani]
MSDLCQMDMGCFLLASLVHVAVRSLSTNSAHAHSALSATHVGFGLDWLTLPLCLISKTSLPSETQTQWWEAAVQCVLRIGTDRASGPSRPPGILPCGLTQLRLEARSARCFGKHSGLLSVPLLFRIAHSLTLVAFRETSHERRRQIADWASGYWQAALQYQTFGVPPPPRSISKFQSRTLPTCAGAMGIFTDKWQYSSPHSPRHSMSSMSSLDSQMAYHALFALPSIYDWWLGVRCPRAESPRSIIRVWCNFGVRHLLSQLDERFVESKCFSNEQKALLRLLIRLLERDGLDLPRKVYRLCGNLMVRYAETSQVIKDMSDMDDVDGSLNNSTIVDPLNDIQRARSFLGRGCTTSDLCTPIDVDQNSSQSDEEATSFSAQPNMNNSSFSQEFLQNNFNSSFVNVNEPVADDPGSLCGSTPLGNPRYVTGTLGFRSFGRGAAVSEVPQNTPAVHSSTYLGGDLSREHASTQFALLGQLQDLLMASLMNNWQSLVNGLSCQLAETKTELSRSRQLNEQLSKQLSETSRQLTETMNKFVECQQKMDKETVQPNPLPESFAHTINLLQIPIHELSLTVSELRRWLPEGMASAAIAAVNAHFSKLPYSPPLMQFYGPNIPLTPTQLPNFGPLPAQSVPNSWTVPFQNTLGGQLASSSGQLIHGGGSAAIVTAPLSSSAIGSRVCASDLTTFNHDLMGLLSRQSNALFPDSTAIPPASADDGLSEINFESALPRLEQHLPSWIISGVERYETCSPEVELSSTSVVGFGQSTLSMWKSDSPNLFTSKSQTSGSPQISQSLAKSRTDDDQFPEAYEPKVDFKPVLERLPDLVDHQTGEEHEQHLFADRARLYRYDKPSATWKTRGVGEVRILHDPDKDKYRLVMRRDQVKKLCANHAITADLKVTPHSKDGRMAMWAVRDFAEVRDGKDEAFMIQFKTGDTLAQFLTTMNSCITKLATQTPVELSTESSQNASSVELRQITGNPSSPSSISLAVRFGPKPGEWNCSTCLLQNSADAVKCVACQTLKPNDKQEISKPQPASPTSGTTDSILSKLAPQPGSWDCPVCLIHNGNSVQKCPACNTTKPGSSPSSSPSSKPSAPTPLFGGFTMSSSGFVFGQPKAAGSDPTTTSVTLSKPLFSFVGTAQKTQTALTSSIPQCLSTTVTSPKGVEMKTHIDSDKKSTFAPHPIFFFGKDPSASAATGEPAAEKNKSDKPGGTFASLDLTGDIQKISQTGGFSFNFGLPGSVNKTQNESQPAASPSKDDQDTDEVEQVDEEKLNFKPVLSIMPAKVTVCTGEENEEVIFCERAKLYRWGSGMWRERGVGELKLLRTPSTGAVRCLMRRDHVLKVCCNHPVTVGMQLKPMGSTDGRAWTWWAIDFTESSANDDPNTSTEHELTVDDSKGRQETFAVRFKTLEHARNFQDLFEDAVKRTEKRLCSTAKTEKKPVDLDQTETSDSDEVLVVEKPLDVSEEQLWRARRLLLPDEFYSFENGRIVGEREVLTAEEEAQEDALLEEAVRSAGYEIVGAFGEHVKDKEVAVPSTDGEIKKDVTSGDDTVDHSHTPPSQSLFNGNATTTAEPTNNLFGFSTEPSFVPFGNAGLPDFSSLSAGLSKDSKPVWATSHGQSTSGSVWATSSKPLFSVATSQQQAGNAEENEENHDPHYEPVVSLPEIVKIKSGEETELCLFLKRCRLYRYVDSAWKERGVGEMKVLIQPHTVPAGFQAGIREVVPETAEISTIQRARLLMRRDQVFKICVNQPIGADLPSFKPLGNSGLSVCWVGVDYSEGTGNHETLAVRFKHDSDTEAFKTAVLRAQNLLAKSVS